MESNNQLEAVKKQIEETTAEIKTIKDTVGLVEGKGLLEPLYVRLGELEKQKTALVQPSKVEVFESDEVKSTPASGSVAPKQGSAAKPAQPASKEPEEDDLTIPVAPGTACKRSGCKKTYVDEATSRGDGAEAECLHHPGEPIFHEGSKGWTCCSRKVLEFEEFLKIKGCEKGKHLFVGSGKKETTSEETIQCRHDWYQTVSQVIMSVFTKKVDANQSTITFGEREVSVNLKTADGKRFKSTYSLYERIDPANSKYEVLNTKVELVLKKANGISWQTLTSDEAPLMTTTFGVSGGTATVGAKEYVLAMDSPLYANKQT